MQENNTDARVLSNKKTYDGADDPALLIVKGGSVSKEDTKAYVKNLAEVICLVYQKYNVVRLRGIGKGANGNADSALSIATIAMEKRDIKLVSSVYYVSVSFDDGERTAMVHEVIGLPVSVFESEIAASKALIEKHMAEEKAQA